MSRFVSNGNVLKRTFREPRQKLTGLFCCRHFRRHGGYSRPGTRPHALRFLRSIPPQAFHEAPDGISAIYEREREAIESRATGCSRRRSNCAHRSRRSRRGVARCRWVAKCREDYVFERIGDDLHAAEGEDVELFGPHDTLILYSFMYGPERDEPCSGCTHLLDGIDGAARHLGQRAAFHVVAKSPIARLAAWAIERGWEHMSLISTAGNATTRIISATRRNSQKACAPSTRCRTARTGTRPSSTCSGSAVEVA